MSGSHRSLGQSGVPDLARWLESVGVDLANANLREFVEAFITTQFSGHDTHTQAFIELARTYCVATVEVGNVLAGRGIDHLYVLQAMARAAAFAAFNSTLSVMKEETPTREITSFLLGEMIFGLQAAAAEHERLSGRDGREQPIALDAKSFARIRKGRRT